MLAADAVVAGPIWGECIGARRFRRVIIPAKRVERAIIPVGCKRRRNCKDGSEPARGIDRWLAATRSGLL